MLVIAGPTPIKPGPDKAPQSNGIFEISILKNGQWKQVGDLRFNKYLREQKVDLRQYNLSGGKIRLRLTQKGGGAAHLDSVLLGNVPPAELTGPIDPLALKKISQRDFDVLDAFAKSLEFSFNEINQNKTLKVTARVEPQKISKTPFQFPRTNLFKSINKNSNFYTYALQSNNGSSAEKTSSNSEKPFFKVLCQTDSGHPDGFTFGWVRNDDKSLYIDLDFTPDNTKDGDKDYARLYIKTSAGFKAFKISESQNRWGSPDFTYTDKVRYQHKKYRFEIPLAELGIEKAEERQELQLAFSAYGTATPRRHRAQLAGGASFALLLKSDGSLWTWGSGTGSYVPIQIGSDTDWVAVAAGDGHRLGLKANGTLWAWGSNFWGQLGDGTNTDKNTPVQVGSDDNWVAVAAGVGHTVGLKADGSLWAWGYNYYGQLGDGTNTDKNSPTQIGSDLNWITIAAGGYHTIALEADGTLWAWGDNGSGQLGDGTSLNTKNLPTEIGFDTDWVEIAGGNGHTVGLKSNGTLWAWGYNYYGQVGNGTSLNAWDEPILIGSDDDWVSVEAGYRHTVALKSDGSLWAWGNNEYGQLGDGDNPFTDTTIPNYMGADDDWIAIAAYFYQTFGLKSDGTLSSWGYNNSGQLGDGTTTDKNTPTIITDIGSHWKTSAAGGHHTVAVKSDGTLWAWGYNNEGEIGDGTTTDRSTPVQEATGATDWVTVGPFNSCAGGHRGHGLGDGDRWRLSYSGRKVRWHPLGLGEQRQRSTGRRHHDRSFNSGTGGHRGHGLGDGGRWMVSYIWREVRRNPLGMGIQLLRYRDHRGHGLGGD
jgi:alpha-tubulin suppressor-like RCC1 family protein